MTHFGDAATLPLRYLAWHYSRGVSEALALWGRSFRFVSQLCATRLHLRTFFAPFERIEEHGHRDLEDRVASGVANGLMRVVGMVARGAVLLMALAGYAAALVGGLAALAGWLLMPFALAAIFTLGLAATLR